MSSLPTHKALINLVDEIFNNWTVISYSRKIGKKHVWLCRCSCGKEKEVPGETLRSGQSNSCGECLPRIDLTDIIFGRLTVIKYCGKQKWLCKCSCGNDKIAHRKHLISGATKSCGCWRQQCTTMRLTKHNLVGLPEYKIHSGMINRCYNTNCQSYHNYGGRGICVCNGWKDSVENFVADMGPRPSDDHSIERIDNNANYSCGHCEECVANMWTANCKWATQIEQGNNQRTNHLLTHDDITMTIAQWSRELKINKHTLWSRLVKFNWSVDEALTTPVRKKCR